MARVPKSTKPAKKPAKGKKKAAKPAPGRVSKNVRLAWFASQLSRCKSDAVLIAEAVTLHKIHENTARDDLAEVYARLAKVDKAERPRQRLKIVEVLWDVAEKAQDQYRYDWTVGALDKIAKVQGLYEKEPTALQDAPPAAEASPRASMVRDRLRALTSDSELRRKAMQLGLDLSQVELVDSGS